MIAINIFMVLNLFLSACKDSFLDIPPTGSITEEVLATKKGVEGLLVGSYAMLNGRFAWYGGSSNWVHGSIIGGDANNSTNAGDQAVVNPVQRYETLPTNGAVSDKWDASFEGVSRANATLRVLAASEDPNLSAEDRARISGEARFLRGHYYFELKRLFNQVPFIDETLSTEEAVKVTNTADIWPNIEADFQYAYDNLPETQAKLSKIYELRQKRGEIDEFGVEAKRRRSA